MSFADQYLARQDISGRIESSPHPDLKYAVVIPCFDEPDLMVTLDSLQACKRPENPLEIIVVVNSPEDAGEASRKRNIQTVSEIREWTGRYSEPGSRVHILHEPSLPVKYAGPGLARKIGMDEAVCRFNRLGRPDGVILSMDADCRVDSNYFVEVEKQFTRKPGTRGFAVYFEHPLRGDEYPPPVYEAIVRYELHLRYYIQAIRNTGFPYAYHAVGSCFGVTAETYVKQGGMNKRKGGEDFYFLQKTIPLGDFHEINTTCVYPSPRPSSRVPFGTGPAVRKYMENSQEMTTYHPEAFRGLTVFFEGSGILFDADLHALRQHFCPDTFKPVQYTEPDIQEPVFSRMKDPESLQMYLDSLPAHLTAFLGSEFPPKIAEINANSASCKTFSKRFYQWFNMFRILKYLNFVHEKHFPKLPVGQAAAGLLREMGIQCGSGDRELLKEYRKIQRY